MSRRRLVTQARRRRLTVPGGWRRRRLAINALAATAAPVAVADSQRRLVAAAAVVQQRLVAAIADVQQRLLTGQVFPEDAQALRAAHMDAYAAEADRQREAVIERSREATRAREKAVFEAESARFKRFQEGSLLERLASSPLSSQAIAQARQQWGITGE